MAYHERLAAEHDARGEVEAAAKHRTAITAHQTVAAKPADQTLSSAAMRASAIADEVSQRVRRGGA